MAETYRPPKAVRAEMDLPALLTAGDVVALRGAGGVVGEWADRITAGLIARAAPIIEEITVIETRDLPPSYRPMTSADVPAFVPSCASCEFFCATTDLMTMEATGGSCEKWCAPVDAAAYCDAWTVEDDCLPGWMQDDDGMETYSAKAGTEVRAAAADAPLAEALSGLVEQAFALYARAHEAHWNVSGSDFAEYHELFQGIYEDVYGSVDPIAENIRKLGSLAPALVLEARDVTTVDPAALASELLAMNEELLPVIRAAFDVATAARQQGVANFLAERQDAHAMWSWQLRASLGIAEVRIDASDVEARRTMLAACEKRTMPAELRTEVRSDGMVAIRGYAAVFDREADGLPFREVIRPGAFARSLANGDECYLLVNHNTDELPLARRSSGTLTLAEDATGLAIEAILDPANPRSAEVISVLSRGDASEMSFAFTVAPDGQTRTKDGLRELRDLNIFEASICTWGAYSDTTVGIRSAAQPDDLEARWLALKWDQLKAK